MSKVSSPEFGQKSLSQLGRETYLAIADTNGGRISRDQWLRLMMINHQGLMEKEQARIFEEHLKEVFESFGSDERFVMIGLSLDKSPDPAREYASKEGLGWIQGYLGDWSATDVPASYGVTAIPAILLIGPDGRIVATNLRDGAIRAAVEAALSGGR